MQNDVETQNFASLRWGTVQDVDWDDVIRYYGDGGIVVGKNTIGMRGME